LKKESSTNGPLRHAALQGEELQAHHDSLAIGGRRKKNDSIHKMKARTFIDR